MPHYPELATSGFDYESITVAASAVGLTAAKRVPGTTPGATRAVLTLETAQVRYRTDGTDPTSSEGHLLEIGDMLVLEGMEALRNFKAIRTGGTSGTLKVTYER